MSAIKHKIIDGSFPLREHRISLIQIDVSLSSGNNVSPFSLSDSPEHTKKITDALSSALRNNWANIVVFPEVSIQEKSLIQLMKKSWELLRSRPVEAGAAVVCLPLEHLSLNAFKKILTTVSACNFFQSGDSSLSSENFSTCAIRKKYLISKG